MKVTRPNRSVSIVCDLVGLYPLVMLLTRAALIVAAVLAMAVVFRVVAG